MIRVTSINFLEFVSETNYFIFTFSKLKKSEVVLYITLPCDQRGIQGYIMSMWDYD